MDINDLIKGRIEEAENRPDKPARPFRETHARPPENPLLRAQGGFPSLDTGPNSSKSGAYPPNDAVDVSIVTYKVAYWAEAGPHDKVLQYDEFIFEVNNALGGMNQFWWHLPGLLANHFLGRGNTHVVQSVEVVKVEVRPREFVPA